jgi:hypothetical protein
MINDFVDLLFTAIAQEEGDYAAGTNIPKSRNNPLDLRYAGQAGARRPNGIPPPKRGEPEPIAEFDTLPHGIAAGYRQIWADIARGDSLRQLISSWAPVKENDTAKYLADVQKRMGMTNADVPLLNYLERGG